MLGIPLGILIGSISGLLVFVVIDKAWETSPKEVKSTVLLTAELTAIPTLWFGGPWLTTKLVSMMDLVTMLPFYLVTLSLTFVPIASWIMFQYMIRLGDIQNRRRGSDGY